MKNLITLNSDELPFIDQFKNFCLLCLVNGVRNYKMKQCKFHSFFLQNKIRTLKLQILTDIQVRVPFKIGIFNAHHKTYRFWIIFSGKNRSMKLIPFYTLHSTTSFLKIFCCGSSFCAAEGQTPDRASSLSIKSISKTPLPNSHFFLTFNHTLQIRLA